MAVPCVVLPVLGTTGSLRAVLDRDSKKLFCVDPAGATFEASPGVLAVLDRDSKKLLFPASLGVEPGVYPPTGFLAPVPSPAGDCVGAADASLVAGAVIP